VPGWIHRPMAWLCMCTLGCQAGASSSGGASAPFEIEVLSVATCEPERTPAPTDKQPPREGTLGVKVRVTGRYEGGVPANYYYASLLSREGDRYLATAEGGCRPLLSGPPLLPGQSREGYANFPLEAKKGAARLAYAPNFEHTTGAEALSVKTSSVEVALP
jgi:hypothetical protein